MPPKKTTAMAAAVKSTRAKTTTTTTVAKTTKAIKTAAAKPKAAAKPTKKDTKPEAAEESEKENLPKAKKAAVAKKPVAKKPVAKGPKEDATKEDAPKKDVPKTEGKATAGRKRKADDGDQTKPVKKARGASAATPINQAPTEKLDVFVFGDGDNAELGLGSKKYDGKRPVEVGRPRLNHNLDANKVGVVQVACGGMHTVALTHDNKLLTWGVNDDKALGRDTTWEAPTRDANAEDSDSDDEDDDTGLNPRESTPGGVDTSGVAPGTKFVQLAASDSASFALTADGNVYGWGTFRDDNGVLGFTPDVKIQPIPMLIPNLSNITCIATGSNHAVALDKDGKVFTWGSGGRYQLGWRSTSRDHKGTLRPQPCGRFTKAQHAVKIFTGNDHSFYIDNKGRVWSWGVNNFGQTGHSEGLGQDNALVALPKVVESLKEYKISSLAGGAKHTVACTEDGKLLTWGIVDGHQVGLPKSAFNKENTIFDERDNPRILQEPTVVPGVSATFVASGTDTSFAIDKEGKVWSWGFSTVLQAGHGTRDDVEVPTMINNTAIKDKKVVWAGAGGQFSMLATVHEA